MENANRYNTLTLAFLGDAVYSLMVRERLVKNSALAAGKLHRMSVDEVNAKAQSEGDIFKRGRNAHPHHSPKNQSEGDYHYATGLEALFGYLYLEGKTDRLNELFDIINKE